MSLGGLASLLHVIETDDHNVLALILVDIAPKIDPEGAAKVIAFMKSHRDGFADLDEAARVVSQFAPKREKPADPSGLMRNLRLRDGRLFWHWDPAFTDDAHFKVSQLAENFGRSQREVAIPTLMVCGSESELIGKDEVSHLQQRLAHAEVAVIDGARHMVAGDDNTVFGAAVLEFLRRKLPRATAS